MMTLEYEHAEPTEAEVREYENQQRIEDTLYWEVGTDVWHWLLYAHDLWFLGPEECDRLEAERAWEYKTETENI